MRPSFEMTRINKVFNLMSEAVADMMDRFSKYPNHAVIEVDEAMTFITADVIFRTIMSSKLDEEKVKNLKRICDFSRAKRAYSHASYVSFSKMAFLCVRRL